MAREIKFRAWCKRYGDREYAQWHKAKSLRDIWGMNYEQRVSLYQSETGNAFAPVEYWEMDYDPHANDEWTGETQPLNPVIGYIVEQGDTLMQYTGLKDKNGVDIYDGDILRAWCDFYDNGLTETVVPVVWIDDLAIFTLGGWGDRSLAAFAGKEVIGNIYENPELLKKVP